MCYHDIRDAGYFVKGGGECACTCVSMMSMYV